MSHAELPPLPVESLFSVVSRRNSSLARRERGTAFGPAAASFEPQHLLRSAGEAMHFGSALPPARRVEVARALERLTVSG